MMRQTIFLSTLVAFSLLTACDRQPAEQSGAAAPADTAAPAVAAPESPTPVPTIVTWGPRKTQQGKSVNTQKAEASGLWIKVTGVTLGRGAWVTFDGKTVKEIVVSPKDNVVTISVPLEYLATPGMKPIVLKTSADGPELAVGDFEVTPAQ